MITLGMANWNSVTAGRGDRTPTHPAMSWLVLDYDEKLVFGQLEDSKPDDIWEDCVSRAIRSKTAEITSKLFKD